MQQLNPKIPQAPQPQMPNIPSSAAPENPLQLSDIHLPDQISSFPIAYGWWLLITLIIVLLVLIIVKFKKAAKRNQVKKQAIIQLKNTTEMSDTDTMALLKSAAMHYFSRAELAKLYGNSLQQFLLKQLPEKHQGDFLQLSQTVFNNQYSVNITNEKDSDFHQAALLWLQHALPPKQLGSKKQAAKTKAKNKSKVLNTGISA